MLHVVPHDLSRKLHDFTTGGGHLVTTYFSGIVDESDRIWPGPHPGALASTLGITVEEFWPLLDGEFIQLDDGSTANTWSERVKLASDTVEVLARYASGGLSGQPAITLHHLGQGTATYLSTELEAADLVRVIRQIVSRLAISVDVPESLDGQLELVVRQTDADEYVFLINHSEIQLTVDMPGALLFGDRKKTTGEIAIPPRGVAVVTRTRVSARGLEYYG